MKLIIGSFILNLCLAIYDLIQGTPIPDEIKEKPWSLIGGLAYLFGLSIVVNIPILIIDYLSNTTIITLISWFLVNVLVIVEDFKRWGSLFY